MSTGGPTSAQLREAIAEAVRSHVSAHDVARLCDVVGMPKGSDDRDPWASKRMYVRDRLMGVRTSQLLEIAAAICEQYEDEELASLINPAGLTGVDGELKNLIFAADGPKPRIVLRDAINNVIEIVENAETCLVYDRPLGPIGLTWTQLVAWWSDTSPNAGPDPARSLFRRLRDSLDSPPEKVLFTTYAELYGGPDGGDTPALVPQVYLHYDPYTVRELASRNGETLKRQRMDFLLLFGSGSRVVIEVDGKQHYAEGEAASPRLYAEMAAEDRRLKLAGYDLYRFGGIELPDTPAARTRLRDFFAPLLARYGSAS